MHFFVCEREAVSGAERRKDASVTQVPQNDVGGQRRSLSGEGSMHSTARKLKECAVGTLPRRVGTVLELFDVLFLHNRSIRAGAFL